MFEDTAHGFLVGGSLIVAVGAQNAFVLRAGLAKRHVGLVVFVCALADSVLIAAGVAGFGTVIRQDRTLLIAVGVVGAAFLAGYGLLSLRKSIRPQVLVPAERVPVSRAATLRLVLAFTLLNPHVYLDTVVLVGSVAAQIEARPDRLAFGGGAVLASVSWFTMLGYGSRVLAPVFESARAWRVLDAAIGLIMLGLAIALALNTARVAS